MKQTKIDWCDCTINPVVGCPRGCEYCYARKMNTRFKWIDDWDMPQFFPERLKQFYCKSPKSVFINSMSDIAYWSDEQILETLEAMANNPQHNYIALSKQMSWVELKLELMTVDSPLFKYLVKLVKPNLYLGYTGTCGGSMAYCRNYSPFTKKYNYFLNIEPIQEKIELHLGEILCGKKLPKAIIIGAETGNRKGKIIPQKKWIDDILKEADKYRVGVFMKESLRGIMGNDFRQDTLPWEVESESKRV